MDFHQVLVGFSVTLSANTATMNCYARLSEEKRDILNKVHNICPEKGMYRLTAPLARAQRNHK